MPLVPSQTTARSRAIPAVLAIALGALGCYKPTIGEKFVCNMSYEPGAGDCPDGFHCGPDKICHKGPPVDAGFDLGLPKPEVHPDVPADLTEGGPEVDAMPEVAMMCYTPVASCTSDTGKKCDPLCQTGCTGCHDKCSVNTGGTLTCNAVPQNTRTRGLMEPCDITSTGSAAQTDNCAPGLVCLGDGCGSRCYHFCKSDSDCTNAPCTHDVGGGVKVCDVPNVTCNPTKGGGADGCGTASDSFACYLSMTIVDRTFCDCPLLAGGPNTACSGSRDCFPGLVCVGAGNPQCRQACDLTKASADCQLGTCTSVNGSLKFGFCN